MYSLYMDGVKMPITPAKIQTKISGKNQTVTLIDDTEINILKRAGLTEWSFDLMIPQVKYPFASYQNGFVGADYFLGIFEELKQSAKPFPFLISRVSPSGNLLFKTDNALVSLEDYQITEDAESGLDVMMSIRLKQYVEYGTKQVVVKTVTAAKAKVIAKTKKRAVTKVAAKTHKVKTGETLWGICKQQLGDGSKYTSVAKLNGIKPANNIKVGQVIKFG